MKHATRFVVDGFEFEIDVSQEISGKFRGIVLFMSRGDTQEKYEKPFSLPTWMTFKTTRGAQIEAESFAYEVIKTGSFKNLLP